MNETLDGTNLNICMHKIQFKGSCTTGILHIATTFRHQGQHSNLAAHSKRPKAWENFHKIAS